MKISGMNKLTLLDYPGQVACIIFTQGCNFKCPFCHNADLIKPSTCEASIKEEEVLAYLESRKNILDGIVISGGEPLMQAGVKDLIKKIKAMGLKVKLDTNGTNCQMLKDLIENKLVDYVAMDIKADAASYSLVSGNEHASFSSIKPAIDLIIASGVDYEFRTTIVKEYHSPQALENICSYIGQSSKYYLQNFTDGETVIQKGLHGFTDEELITLENTLIKKFPNVKVRGL